MAEKARPGRPASRARTAVLPRRGGILRGRARAVLPRLAPSRRSLVAGLAILGLALGAYAIASETSVFAIDRIEVSGGSRQVDAQVRQALEPLLGRSLVGLDGAAVLRDVESLPTVVRAGYDRAFPHVLRVTVVPERPVAVLRRGTAAWLVSMRGRVIETLAPHAEPKLPRIWLQASNKIRVGAVLGIPLGGVQAAALGLAGSFRGRVEAASFSNGSLVFRLRSGLLLVLGRPSGIRLKVAVATLALNSVPAGSTYLDVSVPGRPVTGTASNGVGTNSQVSSRG